MDYDTESDFFEDEDEEEENGDLAPSGLRNGLRKKTYLKKLLVEGLRRNRQYVRAKCTIWR